MYGTSDEYHVTGRERLGGLLVAVITGGRPKLSQRPTGSGFAALRAAGVGDIVWVVSSKDEPGYQRDSADVSVYDTDWAYEYAKGHWMRPEPPEQGGFFGAFPGREWACREAERRGFWGVLQLDDNIERLAFRRNSRASAAVIQSGGGFGLFADLLAGTSLSTNAATTGAQLSSVTATGPDTRRVVRPGFPYSFFIEKAGPGREEWYGPYEDDITHAYQYGDRADGVTAAVMPLLAYKKESSSKTGMRAKYDHTRSVQLQRIVPQSAKIGIRATKSNGRGGPRVFHTMLPGAIRNPVTVTDEELFGRVRTRLGMLTDDWYRMEMESNVRKVLSRARTEPSDEGPF